MCTYDSAQVTVSTVAPSAAHVARMSSLNSAVAWSLHAADNAKRKRLVITTVVAISGGCGGGGGGGGDYVEEGEEGEEEEKGEEAWGR